MTKTTQTGIVDITVQVSKYYCPVSDLATELGLEEAKLRIGLGLKSATACAINEDVVTLGMNAINKLMKRNNLKNEEIGKLEVGTESNFDASKSLKTYFLDLFSENTAIFGCDSINACYGGTNALLNAISWTESTLWDGKYAIVVCTDTCFYEDKNLIPLSGSAACAILIGKNPIFKLQVKTLKHFFKNTYDFYKPRENYPYPCLNGKLSVETYTCAFNNLIEQFDLKDLFKYICCHTPYPKLPEKNCRLQNIDLKKIEPSLILPREIGNPYTASLYVALVSLLNYSEIRENESVLLFSFGSGTASSMFVLERTNQEYKKEDVIVEREKVNAKDFIKLVNYEERKSMDKSFEVKSGFVCLKIEEGKRFYGFVDG